MNYLIINIVKSDQEILDEFKKQLFYNGKIYTASKKNGQDQCILRICSNQIKLDINKYINTINKTYSLEWCKNIPDELMIYFIRGYFDGDGCVHLNKQKGNYYATFVGTESFF